MPGKKAMRSSIVYRSNMMQWFSESCSQSRCVLELSTNIKNYVLVVSVSLILPIMFQQVLASIGSFLLVRSLLARHLNVFRSWLVTLDVEREVFDVAQAK